ncbi:MAG TPA: arginine repressor [Phycisphaerae bacterium]|nr:arginine repressor [Phycisphaerae bacterium]
MIMHKDKRLETITRIVRTRPVATQFELLAALHRKGVAVNQATLSRDLAEVGIRKTGGRYVVPEETEPAADEPHSASPFAAAVRRFTCCGPHMIVLRTEVGQAQAVAVAIDRANDPAFAGTLAGDDTIFVATKNRRTQTVALRRLRHWFGEKHEH